MKNTARKNFNYPKHHSPFNLPEDLRAKGVTENYSTCPGEGFQQEVQQAYGQTNFRDIEPQVVRIDENQEVIACIRCGSAVQPTGEMQNLELETVPNI
ncbi:hypothetical protein M422DRAFT_266328 [Sphaerobolus stellatus SS14]|uniref:Uncharacterized protein n=1 Tax=Sphaerobolus stellatus (strain SS14) TaxID=990650 RepID=A0A0C9V3C8_SPHS4|nr:hypothetical protein M422DRAFT_266328 [Sphaerobolus stellatus SS14]